MTKTELKEIMLKIQNECALEEPSKITYFWNENGKVVFKFYFDSLYLPDDLNLSGEKRSERIKNLFTNQNVYEFQDDFNIIELNTEEGWIKVIPTDQNFKVVDSYKDLKKKKEDDEKEESVTLAGKRLNESVALAEGMILREGGGSEELTAKKAGSGDGTNETVEETNKKTNPQPKDSTKKQTTVLKGKSIFICTVGNPFGKSIEVLSNAFGNNKGQTSFDTLIVIPAYGKEFGIAKGGDFGFKESVREALRKKVFDQNWGLNIFSLEHQESREILQQSSTNDGDDVLFFCAKSQKQEIQSILSNDYKINLQNFFDIEKFHEKDNKKDNKKEDQKNDQSEDKKEDQNGSQSGEDQSEEEDKEAVANENLVEKLKELPAVLSADYIEGKENIAINIVEAFMADVEKIKEAAEEDSKNPKKDNDKNKPNETGKNGEQTDKTNPAETDQQGQSADGKGTITGTAEVNANASASKPAAINASIFLSPYRIHRKLVEKKQSEAYKLETNADWDYYFNKLLGEKWVTAKKEYTKSYQSIPQNVDSDEFKTYFYLGMIAYAYATSNKVLELDKPYIKNEKIREDQIRDKGFGKDSGKETRPKEPGSEDLKIDFGKIGFGTAEQTNQKGGGGLIVNDTNYGGSGQIKTKDIKTPDLSVKAGKDDFTSNEKEAPKSFPGVALPFNLKIWALVDNSKIEDLEKLKKPKLSK